MSKGSNAAYSIMRTITKEAQRDPRRIVFPHAANPRLLRAVQQIVDDGIAKPVLLGRAAEIEKLCSEMSLDLMNRVEVDRSAHATPERSATPSGCTSCASARASPSTPRRR